VIDYTSQKFELSLSGYEFALDCTGESRKCMDVVGHAGTVISIAETPNQVSLLVF
jgi:hypothetical protein